MKLEETIRETQELIRKADEAAANPHFENVGKMLFEARSQLTHGEFVGWIKRNFKMSEREANRYMDIAVRARTRAANGGAQ